MGIDEADLPAQRPNRPVPQQQQPQRAGGLLETPRPPQVTLPGAVSVPQQPPTFTLNKKKEEGGDNELKERTKQDSSSPPVPSNVNLSSGIDASTNLACAPSRQESEKDASFVTETTASTNTTATSSRPGVYAVPGMIGSRTTNVSSMVSEHSETTASTTSTSNNTPVAGNSAVSDPNSVTTILTATKVDEEEGSLEEDNVKEAVRLAQQEAEQLRQQVRSLQQERAPVVVATAAEDVKATHDDQQAAAKRKKCVLLAFLALLFVGVVAGGGTAIYFSFFKQEPIPITEMPSTSPTMAPTIPCLETIITPDDKNYTNGRMKPVLQKCQGDCNVDEDCAEGLICFHRNGAYEYVPGCACWEKDRTRNDYCIEPQTDPCLVETNDFPLGQCEGNCLADDDCQKGLICQGLLPGFEVQGCQFCKQNDSDYSVGLVPGDDNNDVGDGDEFTSGMVPPGFVPGGDDETPQYWSSLGNQTDGDTPQNDTNYTTGILPIQEPNGNETDSKLPEIPPDTDEFVTTGGDTVSTTNGNGRLRALLEWIAGGDEESGWTGDTSNTADDTVTQAPSPSRPKTEWPTTTDELLNGDTSRLPPSDWVELTRPPSSSWITGPPKTEYPTVEGEPIDDPIPFVRYCVPPPDDSFETIMNDGAQEGDPNARFPGQDDKIMSGGVSSRFGGLFPMLCAILFIPLWLW